MCLPSIKSMVNAMRKPKTTRTTGMPDTDTLCPPTNGTHIPDCIPDNATSITDAPYIPPAKDTHTITGTPCISSATDTHTPDAPCLPPVSDTKTTDDVPCIPSANNTRIPDAQYIPPSDDACITDAPCIPANHTSITDSPSRHIPPANDADIPDAPYRPANVTKTCMPDDPGPPRPRTLSMIEEIRKFRLNAMTSEQSRRYAHVKLEFRKSVITTMPIRFILVNPTGHTSRLMLIERDAAVDRVIDSMKKEGIYGDVETMMGIARSKARYGILSHTWGEDELSYKDLTQLHADAKILQSPGYIKMQRFCDVLPRGIEFAWADTVCINKSSSAELDQSIRSMFQWYQYAYICIAYLSQTTSFENIGRDKWFTRGWTLQELLAPWMLKFYGRNWHALTESKNDKERDSSNQKVYEAVLEVTRIPANEIRQFEPGTIFGVATRMSWMTSRVTTREEDISYALMGMFGVSMSPSYGEGSERAFLRLFKELLKISNSADLFNWASHPVADHIHCSCMLPSSPSCFLSLVSELRDGDNGPHRIQPPLLTSAGLRMGVLLLRVKVRFDSDSSGADENRESSHNDSDSSDENWESSDNGSDASNVDSDYSYVNRLPPGADPGEPYPPYVDSDSSDVGSDYPDVDSDSSDVDSQGNKIYTAYLKHHLYTAASHHEDIRVRFLHGEHVRKIVENSDTEVALGLVNTFNQTNPIPPNRRCLAVLLYRDQTVGWSKIPTREVIWFDTDVGNVVKVRGLVKRGVALGFETVCL